MNFWSNLTAGTRRLIILVVGGIIITSMITGYFPELMEIVGLLPEAAK